MGTTGDVGLRTRHTASAVASVVLLQLFAGLPEDSPLVARDTIAGGGAAATRPQASGTSVRVTPAAVVLSIGTLILFSAHVGQVKWAAGASPMSVTTGGLVRVCVHVTGGSVVAFKHSVDG